MSTQTAEAAPITPHDSKIELSLSLDEARVLHKVAQRGLLAAGVDGGAKGQSQQASAAIERLAGLLEEADTVAAVRDELSEAGFDTRRLSNAQVYALARRLAEIPKLASR